jgi:hypothetical protein
MSQNDFNLANQGFPSMRADMNSAFQALASNSSGATEPSTTYAYQWWYDTSTDILKIRNADNDAWISFAEFDQVNDTWSVTANLKFGDNEKLLMGDSDDLQIYHNGSASFIEDLGTGDMYIRAATNFFVQDAVNNETMIYAVRDEGVSLYYNGAIKARTQSYGMSVEGSAIATTDTDTTNTGTVTLDFNTNQNFVLTLTGNVTLANPTTEKVGQSGFIVFIQDGTGGRTVSLGTDYETAGGAGLTLSSAASTTDIVPYVVAASGRILLGAPQLAFA